MNAEQFLVLYDRVADTPGAVARIRRFILDLAVRGRLVSQDSNDQPAQDLMKEIAAQKPALLDVKPINDVAGAVVDGASSSELPRGWTWVRLGETGRVFNGNSVSQAEKLKLTEVLDGYPFIATKDIGYGRDPIVYNNGLRVAFTDTNYKVARAGSVLICSEGGSAGKKIALTDRETCFGNKLYANETWTGIESRYIFYVYQCSRFYEEFTSRMKGIIGGISKSAFLDIPIALPPRAEQQRIVAKVDELMALCDRLEAERAEREFVRDRVTAASFSRMSNPDPETFQNDARFVLDALPAFTKDSGQIDALRKSVLSLAVRGKLVPQEPDEEPAAIFLQRLRARSSSSSASRVQLQDPDPSYEPFAKPDGWEWTTVQDILDRGREISYGVIKLGTEPRSGGIPTLRCSDVKPGFIELSAVRKVSESIESEYARTRLLGGELVINIRGTLGGVAEVPTDLRGFNVAREVAVIPIAREVSAKYLVYMMRSPFFWDSIQTNLRGTAYKGMNLSALRKFLIPFPPLAEQHRIVAKIDQLMAACDQFDASLSNAAETRNRLLDALIAEALLPQAISQISECLTRQEAVV